jgi:hypothetical protein
MKRILPGVAISAFVLYFWGFLYWGLGPYRTQIWKSATNEAAAAPLLREHFPENGVYFVPGFREDPDAYNQASDKGPVAMIHMIAIGGRPGMDPKVMIEGFFLNLVVILLITAVLRMTLPACPTYAGRVKFAALIGLVVAVQVDGGDMAWWQLDPTWKLYQALYTFSVWLIPGLIMARFVDRPSAT